MSSPAMKVVFPAPPPTTNELTALQRTQLVRKTKKIEQLLGTTPHLVDISGESLGPINISFSSCSNSPQRRLSKIRRSSIDSTTSTSSSGSMGSPIRRSVSTTSRISPISARKYVQNTRCNSLAVSAVQRDESWPRDSNMPLLRLAMESCTLEVIPGSPSPTRTSFGESTSPCVESSSRTESSSQRSSHCESSRNSLMLDTRFIIPTPSSLRKQKMDRLRKKLGAGVPLELVFPKETEAEGDVSADYSPQSSKTSPHAGSRNKDCPPLPAAVTRTKRAPRIAHARDSIGDQASIHRAKRQSSSSSKVVQGTVHHKKSRSAPAPLPSSSPAEFKRATRQRLSLIIESPDEHGVTGCTEEFGIRVSRVDLVKSAAPDRTSEWLGAEVKLWSTRMGYEGWRPASLVEETKKSSSEQKKRPTSHRKPVPALPVDSDTSSL